MTDERTVKASSGSFGDRVGLFLALAAALFGVTPLLAQNSNFHHAPASAKSMQNPDASDAQAAESGSRLYAKRCSECHGKHGEGTGNVPPLRGKLDKVTDGEVFWFITKGDALNGMPAWKILPASQRWHLVTYVKTMGQTQTAKNDDLPAQAATTSKLKAAPPAPPFTDFRYENPGTTHKITVADLPQPFVTSSANNGPRVVARPANVWPKAPAGFKVEQYATGLENPRLIRTAPNGDVFVAESDPGQHPAISRDHGGRQAGTREHLRQRAETALRNRVLSARTESAMDVRGQYE